MATTLKGRLLNDGTLGPTTALGDLLDATSRTPLTAQASAINTALTSIFQQMRTRCYTTGVLAEGTNAGTIKTTATLAFSIDGLMYSKAATDNIAMTAAAVQAALTDCAYLVCIDSGGTVSTVKGTAVANGGTLVVPAPVSAATCPFGYIKVALANAATFTAGTTDLSASDVTATYFQLGVLPATTTGSLEFSQSILNTALLAALPAAL